MAGCALDNIWERRGYAGPEMRLLPEQEILDSENPLLKRVVPAALTITCRGLQEATSKELSKVALLSMLLSPLGWFISISKKLIHLAIVFTVWWFVRDEITAIGVSKNVALALVFVAVLYREIYDELVSLILELLVLLTGGGFVRWLCAGYLAGDGARQLMLTKPPFEGLIAVLVNAMPTEYKKRYDEIMNLYLDSAKPESADQLNDLLNVK